MNYLEELKELNKDIRIIREKIRDLPNDTDKDLLQKELLIRLSRREKLEHLIETEK